MNLAFFLIVKVAQRVVDIPSVPKPSDHAHIFVFSHLLGMTIQDANCLCTRTISCINVRDEQKTAFVDDERCQKRLSISDNMSHTTPLRKLLQLEARQAAAEPDMPSRSVSDLHNLGHAAQLPLPLPLDSKSANSKPNNNIRSPLLCTWPSRCYRVSPKVTLRNEVPIQLSVPPLAAPLP